MEGFATLSIRALVTELTISISRRRNQKKMEIMRSAFFTAIVMTIAFGSLPATADSYSAKDAEKYIRDSEAAWSASVVAGDPSVAQRILSEDYVGVDHDGTVLNKADAVAEFKAAGEFTSDHLDYVHIRFFGTTAIAQGQETWARRSGDPNAGRFIWTDTWVLRKGQWQIVNSEDQFQPALK
jgi:hypothetical protein